MSLLARSMLTLLSARLVHGRQLQPRLRRWRTDACKTKDQPAGGHGGVRRHQFIRFPDGQSVKPPAESSIKNIDNLCPLTNTTRNIKGRASKYVPTDKFLPSANTPDPTLNINHASSIYPLLLPKLPITGPTDACNAAEITLAHGARL